MTRGLAAAVSDLQPAAEKRTPRVFTLGQLMANPELTRPPRAVLPPLLYEGRVTLLSAREKVGKSTLAAHAVAELTTGGVFLGVAVAPVTVLWLAIDEPLGDVVRRFDALGADMSRLLICDEQLSVAEFRTVLAQYQPAVVVVDTLSDLWRGRVHNDRDSTETGDFLRPFVNAVRETGAAMLLIYHTSKGGTEYRGSGALGAIVDAPLTLRRRGKHAPGLNSGGVTSPDDDDDEAGDEDGRRLLLGATRWGRVRVRLRSDGDRYELDGTTTLTLSDRILAAVRGIPGRSGSSLATAVSARKSGVLDELRSLESRGFVEERNRGWWPIPSPSVPTSRTETPPGTDAGTDISSASRGSGTGEPLGNRGGTDGNRSRELNETNGSRVDVHGTHAPEPIAEMTVVL
jgi:hypothetical protein